MMVLKRKLTAAALTAVVVFACPVTPDPAVGLAAQTRFELRCGWFSNPTPANAWLIDKDGEWTIGIQGGYQAEGDWPDISERQWVKTNVHYGYGCACIRASIDRKTERVIQIKSGYGKTLAACRRDPALRRKEPK